jgi:MFS family permease
VAASAPTAPEQVRRLVVGLLPTIFVGAIDGSILPVALLHIGQALGDVSLIAWVMAGYLVAGAISTPILGKLSDLHGRRRVITGALAIACAGSTLCALATSMPMLVGARVLQGLGSGALFALAQAAAADVIAGPERGRYQGYFSGVFASSALAAPLLGGYLAEHLSWRAIFWLNLPLLVVALLAMRRVLPASAARPREARIDWAGAALLAAGLATVLIALTRVGQGAGWLTAATLGPLALGALGLAAWAWRESSAPEPIVPLGLFGHRVVLAACAVTLANFFVLIGSTVLIPLAMQTLGGARADEVALRLIALTLAIPAGAFVCGRLMLHGPHLGRLVAAGCTLTALSLAGFALRPPVADGLTAALMVPMGVGLGMTLPAVLVAAQLAVGHGLTGVVTATVSFFRSLGGVLGIAALTSIVLSATDGATIVQASPTVLGPAFATAFGLAAAVSAVGALIALRLGPMPAPARDRSA